MNTCILYQTDGKPGRAIPVEKIRDFLSEDGLVWLDITDPTDGDITGLTEQFAFNPLALDDLRQHKHRPKIAEFTDHIFMIVHELRPAEDRERLERPCVETNTELRIFVGPNYVVTLHAGESEAVKAARPRWESSGELQRQGPYFFLYLILDSLIDDYFPAMDAYDDRIDMLEQLVLQPADRQLSVMDRALPKEDDRSPLEILLNLRRELLEKRRSVAPLRDAINVLLRRVEAFHGNHDGGPNRGDLARAMFAYFQDVYDHTIRIVDTIDTYRDLLAGTLDAHLAVASNRLNEIVKVLTSVSIILMTWATITGIYGMNFAFMPELHWKYGYLYVLGLLAVTGIAEWIYFRRRKWL